MIRAEIPSPPVSSISLGPLTVHFYALCILTGIGVALWWSTRRWVARGGNGDQLFDVVFVAVVAGIIGARIYHVVSSPDAYFGPGGNPVAALYIWNGGLGIWGAVLGGALGAWFMARRKKLPFAVLADTIAPTLMVAQAIGRLGNWFNQELYGGPTTLPWALDITCVTNGDPIGGCVPGTYHPTFLYELLWNLAGCALLLALERRFRLGGGRVFWGYVLIYTTGRLWIELMRTDEAEIVLGLRINVWVSMITMLLAAVMLVLLSRRRAARGFEAHRADGGDRTADASVGASATASADASGSVTEGSAAPVTEGASEPGIPGHGQDPGDDVSRISDGPRSESGHRE
ncbi:prolipoprotein diacylglyceryl transferase [Brachybacterium sp. AOP25-B2-12]|uniref:prolipoprotein diacylglyceryl transferase n=1 Tax=Brachybacterium sp. AOP25-B2-12 TaxID=3457710 RepID=UPI0040347F41